MKHNNKAQTHFTHQFRAANQSHSSIMRVLRAI